MIKINVYGSCVSRDAIWFDKGVNYEVPVYIAMTSILSNLSDNSWQVLDGDIALESSFQKAAVLSDLNRTVYDQLKEVKSDYLMVDLIDERFRIAKLFDDTEDFKYATYSNELATSNFLKNRKIDMLDKIWINNRLCFEDKLIDSYLDKFIDKILNIYEEEKVIIHKAFMRKEYFDKEGNLNEFQGWIAKDIENKNAMYEYMYSYLEKHMPYTKKVDAHNKFMISEKHRWGLTPMHYEDGYYYEILRLLQGVIEENEHGQ